MRINRNNESDEENDWITTYSDMVTLLLAFFVLLFSFSEVDATKWKEIVKSLSGKETIIFEQSASDSIMENNTDNIADIYDNKGNEDEKSEAIDDEEAEEEIVNEEVEEEIIEEEIVEEEIVEEEVVEEETVEEEVAKEEVIEEEIVEEVAEEPVIAEEEIVDEEEIAKEEEVIVDEEVIEEEEEVIEEEEEVIEEEEEVIEEEELLIQYEFDELYNDLVQYNKDENMNSEIMKSKSQIIIRLSNSILFEPDEADINSAALEELKKLAIFIKKYDEVVDKIITEGNTDNIPVDNPNYRDNFELSLERSLSVLYFFKYDGEFKPEKLIPIGYGENNPIGDNDTAEGRAENRRTDIVLVKKKYISEEQS